MMPGTTQPNFEIFGVDAYYDTGKGIGLMGTVATMVTNYTIVRGSREDYNGNVHKMARDIFSGKDSPISPPIAFRVWAAQQALAWWGE